VSTRKVWPDTDDLVQLVMLAERMGRRAPLLGSSIQGSGQDGLIRALAGVVAYGSQIIHERRWVPPAQVDDTVLTNVVLTRAELRTIVRKLGRWPNRPPCGTRVVVVE